MLADMESLEKRKQNVEKKAKGGAKKPRPADDGDWEAD